MEVVSESKVTPVETSSPLFVGGLVPSQPIISQLEDSGNDLNFGIVNFSPGARNVFHTHTSDQILYVIRGKGIIADEQQEIIITVGDTAFIPSGERHWHGATADSHFSHVAVTRRDSKTEF